MAHTNLSSAPAAPNRIVDAIFVNLLAVVGLVAMWDIYADPWFIVVAGVSLVAANLIAWFKTFKKLRMRNFVALLAAAYVLVAILFAAPSIYSAPAESLPLILQILVAPVAGWKQLLTLDLPLGTYQAMLAPVVLLTIFIVGFALALVLQNSKRWVLAVPLLLALTVFGIGFGSSAVSGGFVQGQKQLIIGVLALCLALGMIVWRTGAMRRAQLNLTVTQGDAKRKMSLTSSKSSKYLVGAAMLAVAVIAATIIAPATVSGATRDVLRSGVDPQQTVTAQPSPLASYRDFFSDERLNEVLFEVTSAEEVTRVRLASMHYYDGNVLTVVAPTQESDAAAQVFARVPSSLSQRSASKLRADVTIQNLDGVWVPLLSGLESLSFSGANRSAFEDGFFYHSSSGTGVQLAHTANLNGMSYTLTSSGQVLEVEEIQHFQPVNNSSILPVDIVPQALVPWVSAQNVTSDVAGLIELIDRMRDRGYLSHSFYFEDTESPLWIADLGNYSFEPSRAGHSTARINALFELLLGKQEQVGDGAAEELLVAGIGDDEQFAVAAMLLADHFGFKSRVALGVRLAETSPGAIPACDAGICNGSNVSAWLEIQDSATGEWGAIDVTPQHKNPPTPDTKQSSDPQNSTQVERQNPTQVAPPEPNPAITAEQAEREEATKDAPSWILPLLKVLGIGLLSIFILLSPLLIVLGAKRLRRSIRRKAPHPEQRIVGGWLEYVDQSVDEGHTFAINQTRSEIAEMISSNSQMPAQIALLADQAVFAGSAADDLAADYFWQMVDAERSRNLQAVSFWKKLKIRLSLKSFKNSLARLQKQADLLETR